MNITKIKNFALKKIKAEISDKLTYHGAHHVLDVLNACNEYIIRLKINEKDAHLLRVAAIFHDIGVIWTYQNHEERGIDFIKEILPQWGYSKSEIEKITGMINATRLPQSPKNILEQIICDSDLDYLGKDQFYEIGETLFTEFKHVGILKTEEEWDRLQVKFLENHHYHTEYAKKYRQPKKLKRIAEIKKKWNWE